MGNAVETSHLYIAVVLSLCLLACVYLLSMHVCGCKLWLVTDLFCSLPQDLKDVMRKVGEVTFVDAHRPNQNEG